jgi:imidazole glycerol-phosphate synthase subunit HisF
MLKKKIIRIIPFLDIKNGLLIKGINLEGLRILGNAEDFAEQYYKDGADEICYIDNVATLYGTNNLVKHIKNTAKKLFIPLSVAGGIRNLDVALEMFKAGADKIIINSAVIDNINFLKKLVSKFGSANVSVLIQSIKINKSYVISKSNGRDIKNINPIEWAKRVEDAGAGEIIITSVNNEGLMKGFDIGITKRIAEAVSLPVIAHGGAGNLKDIYEVIKRSKISGVGIASMLHYDAVKYLPRLKTKIGNRFFIDQIKVIKRRKVLLKEIKNYLRKKNIYTR